MVLTQFILFHYYSAANTIIDPLYWSERNGDFVYNIPVLPGSNYYEVLLHMAEVFWNSTDQRVFSVFAEGQTVIENLDLVRDIGAPFTAKIYSFGTQVTDGNLTIEFVKSVDMAKVSGVEVFYLPGSVAPPFGAPVSSPTETPSTAPTVLSSSAPSAEPTGDTPVSKAPSAEPTGDTPVSMAPSSAPSIAPSTAPTVASSMAPSLAPSPAPSQAPSSLPAVVARVNSGSFQFSQTDGTVWLEDTFNTGGSNFTSDTITVSKYHHKQ